MKTTKLNLQGTNNLTFGIDLGTTNSAIAVVDNGNNPNIIVLDNGKHTMPSCVSWLGGENFIIGKEAYENRANPNTIYSVKRLIGTDKTITLEHNGEKREFTPVEISALILKGLCEKVEYKYGKVKDVVITVPAYFDNNQVQATRDAGELIGLNVLSTFREPTSAALKYVLESEKEHEKVVIYDLGGGTFDVSLVNCKKEEYCEDLDEIYGFESVTNAENRGVILDVIKKEGDMFLGGDDIDEILLNIVLDKLKTEHNISTDNLTKQTRESIKLRLEQYKKDSLNYYKLNLNLKYTDGTSEEVEDVLIGPSDFDKATRPIYNRTKAKLEAVLEGQDDVSSIILVGGSTKSQLIRSYLAEDYPNVELVTTFEPDESVALGAAVQAKRLVHGDNLVKVFDILPLSIGVLSGGRVQKLLKKDQSLPYSMTNYFNTTEDNQTHVNIEVYQGQSNIPQECVHIGTLRIDNIPPAKKGEVIISVNLSVNVDGVLRCSVRINDIFREVELTNVLRGKNVATNLNKNDRLLIRWKALSNKLGNPKELEELLIKFEKDTNNKEIEQLIKNFISKHK